MNAQQSEIRDNKKKEEDVRKENAILQEKIIAAEILVASLNSQIAALSSKIEKDKEQSEGVL